MGARHRSTRSESRYRILDSEIRHHQLRRAVDLPVTALTAAGSIAGPVAAVASSTRVAAGDRLAGQMGSAALLRWGFAVAAAS